MELSREQQRVFDALVESDEHVQTLGGYAGTGKTTLIIQLAETLRYGVAAYTGKAAHVLRLKGCPDAGTIHSLIYRPVDNTLAIGKATEYLERLQKENARPEDIGQAVAALALARKPKFTLRDELTDQDGDEIPGVIIDEASMVREDMYNDLLSFGVPLIFVGDHGQLPPVSDTCAAGAGLHGESFNLMAEPMYRLETIHRNAGPIAYFAEHIRKGASPASYRQGAGIVQLANGRAPVELLLSASQVICPFNGSRCRFNRWIREAQGRRSLLEVGERIICLRNDKSARLFNGMHGTVTWVDRSRCLMDFEDDGGGVHETVAFDPRQFGLEKYEHHRGGPHPFDYGYVVTCHKAQGSEWPHVLVLDQGWKWEYTRWAYTAASRARERLSWITMR
jgi:exodeoxyribonuclease-5